VVNGEEYFFDANGIESSKNMVSHSRTASPGPPQKDGTQPSHTLVLIGKSKHTGAALCAALAVYFEAGKPCSDLCAKPALCGHLSWPKRIHAQQR
jgi:hypothetical protein